MTMDGKLSTVPQGQVRVQTITRVIAPAYEGPALVRGRHLTGPGVVRFGSGQKTTTDQLRLPGGGGTSVTGAPGWRSWVTIISVLSPGSYGFQVDGVNFSTVILFQAS
jgi:hypothetical protein